MATDNVYILGAGMHPWGKWGHRFTTYGVVAIKAALKEADVNWRDIDFVAGAATMRNGYPGYVAGATFAQAMGWSGQEISSSYAACASGSQALASAYHRILSGQSQLALVVGADTTPKGFFAPQAGERPDDPDWVRFCLGITNASYFGLYARYRMDNYGTTDEDLVQVKLKNAQHGYENHNARYRKLFTAEEVLDSPMVASPLRLLQICATSDGAAALVLASEDYCRHKGVKVPSIAAISTATPTYASANLEMPDLATDSWASAEAHSFRRNLAANAYEQAGIGAEDLSLAEVYDLSSAMELEWYEDIGLCAQGEAENLLRNGDTTIGGSIPVNPSGGLTCFGEAVPAQALAQVCELTWQLQEKCGARQVASPRWGLAVNQGLFGHGAAVIVKA